MTNAIGIALSGLQSAGVKLNASASNIANLATEGSLSGEGQAPYSALTTVSTAQGGETGGVSTRIVSKEPGFVPAFSPGSPFADENGLIGVPNVDFAEDIVKMKLAEIEYKANIGTFKAAREMNDELLGLFDETV